MGDQTMKYLVMHRGRPALRTNDISEARRRMEQLPGSYIHYGRLAREEYMSTHEPLKGDGE